MSQDELQYNTLQTIETDVLIIGGGLAGLACAGSLQRLGVNWQLLEASDRLGGRVATDEVEGFLLDRGFQVLLSSYEEVAMQVAQEDLPVSSFACGALLPEAIKQTHVGFAPLLHPLHHPEKAWASLETFFKRFGFKDAIGLLRLLAKITFSSKAQLERTQEETAAAYLERFKFSQPFFDDFLTPFFGGVFLETPLKTSVRKFLVLLRYFATGRATLPQGGMQALPKALAKNLPQERIHLNTKALRLTQGSHWVQTEAGETFLAKHIVLATDLTAAAQLLQVEPPCKTHSSTCWYFALPKTLVEGSTCLALAPQTLQQGKAPLLLHWCFPSEVEPSYSSNGETLLSVSTRAFSPEEESFGLEEKSLSLDEKLGRIRKELAAYLPEEVKQCRFLRAYEVHHALPSNTLVFGESSRYKALLEKAQAHKLHLCGDYTDYASINGALRSGRVAAVAVFRMLKGM